MFLYQSEINSLSASASNIAFPVSETQQLQTPFRDRSHAFSPRLFPSSDDLGGLTFNLYLALTDLMGK